MLEEDLFHLPWSCVLFDDFSDRHVRWSVSHRRAHYDWHRSNYRLLSRPSSAKFLILATTILCSTIAYFLRNLKKSRIALLNFLFFFIFSWSSVTMNRLQLIVEARLAHEFVMVNAWSQDLSFVSRSIVEFNTTAAWVLKLDRLHFVFNWLALINFFLDLLIGYLNWIT